jgi:DNA-binding MarR family transcriptional regulator
LEEHWLTPYLDRMEELSTLFFRHFHQRMCEQEALSPSQYFVLRTLQLQGPATVSDLAAHLGMTAPGATGLIDRLVKAGLVSRERDQEDRRVVRVSLTPEGARQYAATRALRRRVLAELVERLSAAEVEQLVALYEKMFQSIRSM